MKYPIYFGVFFSMFLLSACGGSSGSSNEEPSTPVSDNENTEQVPQDDANATPGVIDAPADSAQTESAPVVFEYVNFANPIDLNIQGDAIADLANGVDSDSVLRLTSSVGDFQTGTAYHLNAVPLETFEVEFSFRITDSNGFIDRLDETGADGFALIFQALGDVVGASGGELGYGGISPSVAVEIDTYTNRSDPDSNHVGVNINGDTSSTNNSVFVEPRFDDENQWYAWVDYNQPILEIRLAQLDQRPDEVTLITTVDIPAIIGQSTGFVGFTSATGLAHSNHDILNWAYRSNQ